MASLLQSSQEALREVRIQMRLILFNFNADTKVFLPIDVGLQQNFAQAACFLSRFSLRRAVIFATGPSLAGVITSKKRNNHEHLHFVSPAFE
jgi:hypothetical protein